ncbi:unnamed protein product [Rhizophagus irregularis]|nr:unnamed protein product [Rhizophagus irregularis]
MKGLDIKIDLHDFDIEYKVFDHILVLFGKRKHHSDTSTGKKVVGGRKMGITHIKVPKNGTFKKLLDTKYCALCKFRECLCKHFPVLSEILE